MMQATSPQPAVCLHPDTTCLPGPCRFLTRPQPLIHL
jgi:hypothetical protein